MGLISESSRVGLEKKSSLQSTYSHSCSSSQCGHPGPGRGSEVEVLSPFLTQDLLKHTPEDHPDHPLLLDAQRNIKQVAERINKGVRSAEEAERHARVLQEIEAHIEGMEDVSAPHSTHGFVCICGHLESQSRPHPQWCLQCVHIHVCQHLHPSLAISMSSSVSVSGHMSHHLTHY